MQHRWVPVDLASGVKKGSLRWFPFDPSRLKARVDYFTEENYMKTQSVLLLGLTSLASMITSRLPSGSRYGHPLLHELSEHPCFFDDKMLSD